MNAMKNKIKSRDGASITFALLIFMVCAIISMVVVVAGRTAADWMSQQVETDRRYYAVSSAVQLLCEDFKSKVATVKYTKQSSATSVPGSDIVVTAVIDKDSTNPDNPDIQASIPVVAEASRYLVEKIANTIDTNTTDPTYKLTTSLDGDTKYALKCDIKELLYRDGRLVFVLSTPPQGEGGPLYTLQATFTASINESTIDYMDAVTGKAMKDVTTTIEWKFGGIKKGA